MHALSPPLANVIVKEGDGRDLQDIGLRDESIDIVFTSPPYPNNIDYSEVYKLELWLLGFIESSEQFLQLRKSTLRSHPSSDLAKGPNAEFMQAIGTSPLKRWVDPMISRTASFTQRWQTTLVLSYFSDLWTSLKEQFRCLKEGGRAFLVVANSLHGNSGNAYLIPTDLLVGQLGNALGFELERILVARNTRRRLSGNHFLRESVVVLRKPYGKSKRAAL
jgi:DNA modification methylase